MNRGSFVNKFNSNGKFSTKSASVAELIVDFFTENNIESFFGHPGGMVSFLIDAVDSHDVARNYTFYNEQGAGFAASGLTQATGKVSVAYATSGPGATNLVTTIAHNFFDSYPVFYITGNVSKSHSLEKLNVKHTSKIRQHGFQELDIVKLTKSITKRSIKLNSHSRIIEVLKDLFLSAIQGRPGPVLLDIPVDVSKKVLTYSLEELKVDYKSENLDHYDLSRLEDVINLLSKAERPIIILGNGAKTTDFQELSKLLKLMNIPYCTSMLSTDLQTLCPELYIGFSGVYGHRIVNYAIYCSDLILSLGARLDLRQVGFEDTNLLKNKRLIRVDLDEGELQIDKSSLEIKLISSVRNFVSNFSILVTKSFANNNWLNSINLSKKLIGNHDYTFQEEIFELISDVYKKNIDFFTDVGQNQVWSAQYLRLTNGQKLHHSGGLGSMGFSLPAAIGTAIGTGRMVVSINGDGGIQMNIQELQTVFRENLNIKIIVINNKSLGMISEFQNTYLEGRNAGSSELGGYTVPNFVSIANAYGIRSDQWDSRNENLNQLKLKLLKSLEDQSPFFLNILIDDKSVVNPKTVFGKGILNRAPEISHELEKKVLNILGFIE
jgi:acetolactate synthase I/II/III large subunit